ncbi:alpha/beta fold hydrolase [Mycobacterium sp. Marseille-P9652]|uniref:alpha/beta fold hydrolase n=1 Tax=Mycobacterium sp. Marseille-P9652 TaxID=2654950 RepID=UPI0012E7B125|nr:alpha/beta hydrolase [Mycobacterium sp. Marseille-P9652]
MDLFVRESGPARAPAIVFLHGAYTSGWSWEAVVERMQQYRCLVPDLPHFGKSFELGPFDMGRAAGLVAELIRSRVRAGRAHIVGLSLGAQVGVQLLATEPELVDRAVLCGTFVNTLPFAELTRRLVALPARNPIYRWMVRQHRNAWQAKVPRARLDDYRDDVRLITSGQLADVIMAAAGFTIPEELCKSESPTLFVTGSKELPSARRWAAVLARQMPHGVNRVAVGMPHDWPTHYPDLFARTLDAWLADSVLPPEIARPKPVRH